MTRGRIRHGTPLAICLAAVTIAGLLAVRPDAAGRRGPVRLQGHALADDDGPFLALGATLFWALWGERHDPERLDQNLAWLAAHDVDYVRALGMVGGPSWEDRPIDPSDESYWATVDGLLARLERHGLRLQITIFAEAGRMMPDANMRRAFADAWADRASRSPDRFVLIEVANEHWQNGLEDIAELRALGRRLSERTDVLVALSSPFPGSVCELYSGAEADIATIHYGRTSEAWGAVQQPWVWPGDDVACRESLPVFVSNEPVGPQSSIVSDDDPTRLVMSYITTFLAGNAAYVIHAGAGVRGGGAADRALGRAASFSATPNLQRTLMAIEAARDQLPADLANWARVEPGELRDPFPALSGAVKRSAAAAAYTVSSGNRFVTVVLDARERLAPVASRWMEVAVHDPLTGMVTTHALEAGDPLALEGRAAFLLVGEMR